MKTALLSLRPSFASFLLAAALCLAGTDINAQTPRGGHNGNGGTNGGTQPRGGGNGGGSNNGGGNPGAQPRGQYNNGGNDNYNNNNNGNNSRGTNGNNGDAAPPNNRGGQNPNNNGNTAPPNNRGGQVHPRTGQPLNNGSQPPSNSGGSYGNNGGQGNYSNNNYNDNNRGGSNPNYRPRDSYYQRYYRPNYQPTQPTAYYNTWHSPDRVWIPGYYSRNYYGQQVWVNGHWRVRRNGAYVIVYDPAPQYASAYNPSMSPGEFNNAMTYLYSLQYEDTRMSVGQQMLSNHVFTSDQVHDIVMAYQFESNRVEIAKMAYLRTLDPQNFYVVYDAFQYESSVIRVDGYIASLW